MDVRLIIYTGDAVIQYAGAFKSLEVDKEYKEKLMELGLMRVHVFNGTKQVVPGVTDQSFGSGGPSSPAGGTDETGKLGYGASPRDTNTIGHHGEILRVRDEEKFGADAHGNRAVKVLQCNAPGGNLDGELQIVLDSTKPLKAENEE